MIKCSKCDITKDESEFYESDKYKDGYWNYCKECARKQCQQWYFRHRKSRIGQIKRYHRRNRLRVLKHYGGDPPKCACCGENHIIFLTIDHMHQDGAEHRRKTGIKGSSQFYIWLIKNDFPEEFQVLCWNCQWGRQLNNGICPHQKESKI